MVHRSSAQATALPRQDLHLPQRPEMAKRGAHSDPEMLACLAPVRQTAPMSILQAGRLRPEMDFERANQHSLAKGFDLLQAVPDWTVARRLVVAQAIPRELRLWRAAPMKRKPLLAIRRLPEENRPVEAMQLLWELVHLGAANRRLLEDLDLRRTEQRLALVRRPAARTRLQDLRLRRVTQAHFPLLLAHAPQCSKDPGPYAFSRGIPVAQKCNRAVRCGGRPIFARYRRPRNRRELAGCDSRCSRLRRKRAGPARPFPIAVEDKRRCRPLPFADQDARFANLG